MKVTAIVAGITRPATTDVPQSRRNRTRMAAARISPMTMASRTLDIECTDEVRLIVEGADHNARAAGSFADCSIWLMDFVRYLDGIAVRLSENIQQNRRFPVSRHDGVDRLHGGATEATSCM